MNDKKDYYLPVVFSQIAVCSVIIFLIFFISKTGDGLKSDFTKLIKQNFESLDIKRTVEAIKEVLPDSILTVFENTDNLAEPVFNGMGGSDIEFFEASEKTSFAPIFTTAEICPPIEKGRYSSYFGYRTNPISGDFNFHTGLDIACAEGTKIRAAYSGTVTKCGFDEQAGNYIYIAHDDGLITFYCHCSELLVDVGTVIRRSESIALVGSTGYATGPHLHFEVRKDGIRYNPIWLLEK